MAKRRAEDMLRLDSPSKKRYLRPFFSVDTQLESSMAPTGGVSPPSLLAVFGSRCRKRPYCFENEANVEEADHESSLCESKKHSVDVVTEPISGSFQHRRSSCTVTTKKRPRVDRAGSETVTSTADKSVEDPQTEDCLYNSFQYWRVPLPDLDLSLLDDPSDRSQTKNKSKVNDTSLDSMET